ncbi:MAG: C39 family peptidase [bacterium]|nr:C39 family peptidase [bacterium]
MPKLIPNKIKNILILFVLFILLFPVSSVKAEGTSCKDMKTGDECAVGEYTIRYNGIDIATGDRKFIVKTVQVGYDERYIDSPYLTDYLAAMYRYAVILSTILATIVIIFAGVLWITSAGNAEQIGRAKKMIGRAITGLILAVGSYTILWTINPQLVEFGSLKILRVLDVDISGILSGIDDQDKDYPVSGKYSNFQPATMTAEEKEKYLKYTETYYAQSGGAWGSTPYGTACPEGEGTYKASGCAPTAIAMVLKHLGKEVDPKGVGDIAVETGARDGCSGGTDTYGKGDGATKFLEALKSKYNVKIDWVEKDKALSLIKDGKWLIQSGAQAGFTGLEKMRERPKGHYLVFTEYVLLDSKQEIIRINDSGKRFPTEGIVYKTMELFNDAKRKFLYIDNL